MPIVDRPPFRPTSAPPRTPDIAAVMADPEHFDVEYVINAYMDGHIGSVDKVVARQQWQDLVQVFLDIGLDVSVLRADEHLADLVFAANQSFPLRDGTRRVVLSQMAMPQRRPEVAHFRAFYEDAGFECLELPPNSVFEGMGDVLWHPGRRFAYAGWGFRTHRTALEPFADLIQAPVVALRLVDDRFYHLDTCLSPLDERCALYVRQAFDDAGLAAIHACFPDAVAVPVQEAARGFACNGVSVRGHFVVQRGCTFSAEVARSRGLEVVEVETSEFLKSGGSVGCLHIRLGEAL